MSAQFGGYPHGGSNGGNPYLDGGQDGDNGRYPPGFAPAEFGIPGNAETLVTAHSVIATIAFGLLLPCGSILIRLGLFRGLWLVHGIIQTLTYLFFIAAAALGIFIASHSRAMTQAHPIIGIVLLALLFFQPFLGLLHHFAFKKHSKRVVWSYAHIWLGRLVITLGIINGGLGLQLSKQRGRFAPHQSTVIGYSVAAGIIWLIYVASAVYGERKRSKANYAAVKQGPPSGKEGTGENGHGARYA